MIQKNLKTNNESEEANDPFYSEANMKYLKKVIDDIQSGRAVLSEHELIEVDETDDDEQ